VYELITPSDFIDILIESQKTGNDHLEHIMKVLLPKVDMTPQEDYCYFCQHCQGEGNH